MTFAIHGRRGIEYSSSRKCVNEKLKVGELKLSGLPGTSPWTRFQVEYLFLRLIVSEKIPGRGKIVVSVMFSKITSS